MKTNSKVKIVTLTPMKSPLNMDIMIDGEWKGNIRFDVLPGHEYKYSRFKALAKKRRPSLSRVDFDLIPCRPIFK